MRPICASRCRICSVTGVSPVVCINRFASDHQSEIDAIFAVAQELGVRCALSNHWAEGGAGATDLARAVIEAAEEPTEFRFLYELEQPIKAKIEILAKEIYGAADVIMKPRPRARSRAMRPMALATCRSVWPRPTSASPMIPSSRGHRPALPSRSARVRASVGAGFIYPLAGDAHHARPSSAPAAERVDIDFETAG
ncbi:MAG: formate--tetrahydrofolate ligase [Caldilineaceae bacterium]